MRDVEMKTWYEGHDKIYKKRKENGWPGWDESEETVDEIIANLENAFSYLCVPEKGNLLELGCGAGNIALWSAQKGYKVYGVDISPAAIEWAREKAIECKTKADFRVGNVLDLKDYDNDFFDIVLDGHCLHCIIGKDRKAFLSSVFRVLKKGGFFHVSTMCNIKGFLEGFDPETRCTVHGDIATRYIGLSGDILKEITDAGFSVIDWKIIHSEDRNSSHEELLAACTKD